MKSLQILFFLTMLMALVIANSETPFKESQFFKTHNSTKNPAIPSSESEESASLRGTKGHKYGPGVMTCDKYPRVCHVAGSGGPDCCRKKCVNVSTDRNNCGMCGKRCKYSQICCKGKCVNPMFNKHHCGTCDNKCNKGNSCVYGMCSYA
ncbi:stigma-specific STIG1-like protein 1 [Gastrolobium bilobum]|uniref:stigma-specific STIG1-like protein 1 n=1 Tax=Gastrolobium bilobum TaxID=150636 RepID=UPI002AB26E8C|nr:stigma-specific STIG1-like protein 1 [Gastrolobium bilobum]